MLGITSGTFDVTPSPCTVFLKQMATFNCIFGRRPYLHMDFFLDHVCIHGLCQIKLKKHVQVMASGNNLSQSSKKLHLTKKPQNFDGSFWQNY